MKRKLKVTGSLLFTPKENTGGTIETMRNTIARVDTRINSRHVPQPIQDNDLYLAMCHYVKR